MKLHYVQGDRISFDYYTGETLTGIVQSQTGSILKVKWDHVVYRPQDEPALVDLRDVQCINGK
jgi:hypothetical protein